MPTYRAYGLILQSDVALPGVDLGHGPADVTIRMRRITPDILSERPKSGQWIGGTYQDKANILVADGNEISVDVRKPIPEGDFVGLLLGELMATVLRQRGVLVIHACAVADADGNAIVFAGESGWGKSTLAEYFCQNGWTLVTDDVTAIDLRDDGAFAIPSYSQIRLREDAAAHLVADASILVPIDRNGFKQAREDHALAAEPRPLCSGFFLDPSFSDGLSIAELLPQEALMRLVAHTRARTLVHVNAPDLLRDHLSQCTRLLQRVPMHRLQRRESLADLEAIQALVTETLRKDLAAATS